MPPRVKFSLEEIVEICRLHIEERLTIKEISIKFNTYPAKISGALKENGE